ncbi:Potassium-transporting ATPase alpha chain 1 [Durusdinium trenchii]|uniref:Potassium-transporting ATPase alpha chain 1 n=1 Tax=Durusdinium trenchii TaxID=1381693 RepID=A0ABP0RV28_9DINO
MGRWRRSGVVTTAALCLLATLRTDSFVPSPDGASPPISEERRRAAAVRDPTNGRRTFAAAALAAASLVAGAPAHAKEVIQVLPPVPPKPSPDPFIYNLQVAAWKKEPYARMRLYLQAVTQRFIMDMETSAFGGKYFLHWSTDPKSDDFFKFDVVDRNVYNEAAREKKILIDSDLTLAENGIEVYVYKDQQAKEDLTTKVEDLVIIPSQLQNAIRVIQSTPFPEFVGGSRRVQQQKITIEDKN